MIPDILTASQFGTVYNFLSLVIASQLFTAIFLLVCLPRVLPRYRQAITVAIIVCGIAAYHYFRIFDSFRTAFVTKSVGGTGNYTQAVGDSFNEGYRYVDWVLTVPLLLVELIAVLALARAVQRRLLVQLVPAAIAMIVLGYPGEISSTSAYEPSSASCPPSRSCSSSTSCSCSSASRLRCSPSPCAAR